MRTVPKAGEIWKFEGGHRIYILKVVKEKHDALVIEEDQTGGIYSLDLFGSIIKYTGDRVPFEDIAAILFPEKED